MSLLYNLKGGNGWLIIIPNDTFNFTISVECAKFGAIIDISNRFIKVRI